MKKSILCCILSLCAFAFANAEYKAADEKVLVSIQKAQEKLLQDNSKK